MTTKVLYYPTIEFMDEAWLKSSLCVWDKVYRIVPESYEPKDSDEVKIAVDNGVVENIVLTEQDLSQTADEFIEFVESADILPAGLDGYHEFNHRLHPEKMDARVLPILEELSREINVDGFLNVSSEVANLYMLYLSNVVSRRRGISKLTDNGDMFSVMHYFANDGNFDEWVYNEEAEELSTALAISSILPSGIESINIGRVLEFRKTTEANRSHFKKKLDELINELIKIEDEGFSENRVKEYITELEDNNSEVSQRISEFFGEFKYSLLSVGLPTAASTLSLLSGSGNIFDLSNIGKSCLIGAVSAIADASRSKRKEWSSQDSFYYHQMKDVFGGKKGIRYTLPNYHRIYEEFIND